MGRRKKQKSYRPVLGDDDDDEPLNANEEDYLYGRETVELDTLAREKGRRRRVRRQRPTGCCAKKRCICFLGICCTLVACLALATALAVGIPFIIQELKPGSPPKVVPAQPNPGSPPAAPTPVPPTSAGHSASTNTTVPVSSPAVMPTRTISPTITNGTTSMNSTLEPTITIGPTRKITTSATSSVNETTLVVTTTSSIHSTATTTAAIVNSTAMMSPTTVLPTSTNAATNMNDTSMAPNPSTSNIKPIETTPTNSVKIYKSNAIDPGSPATADSADQKSVSGFMGMSGNAETVSTTAP